MPGCVFLEEGGPAAEIWAGMVGGGFGQDVHRAADGVDGQEADTEKAAELMGTRVAVAALAGGRHGKPKLVGAGEAVGGLQEQVECESALHLDDDEAPGVGGVGGNDVAVADLTFRVVATLDEEPFDGGVEGGLARAAGTGLPARGFAHPIRRCW